MSHHRPQLPAELPPITTSAQSLPVIPLWLLGGDSQASRVEEPDSWHEPFVHGAALIRENLHPVVWAGRDIGKD